MSNLPKYSVQCSESLHCASAASQPSKRAIADHMTVLQRILSLYDIILADAFLIEPERYQKAWQIQTFQRSGQVRQLEIKRIAQEHARHVQACCLASNLVQYLAGCALGFLTYRLQATNGADSVHCISPVTSAS